MICTGVQFAVDRGTPPAAPTGPEEEDGKNLRTHESARGRVLLVEDNADERAVLADFLRLNGFDVEEACDGQDGLERLFASTEAPAVIVTDIYMPRLDGWRFVDVVQRYHRFLKIPVIVVSANDWPNRSGYHFVRKPSHPEKLVSLIAQLINSAAVG